MQATCTPDGSEPDVKNLLRRGGNGTNRLTAGSVDRTVVIPPQSGLFFPGTSPVRKKGGEDYDNGKKGIRE